MSKVSQDNVLYSDASFPSYVNIYVRGIVDALSIHKTFPTLVNNPATVYIILKIFAANAVLIVGSELLFHKGIVPFLDTVNDKVLDLQDSLQYQSLLYMIYQSLWLLPICVLCYACSLAWYQELADCIEKYNNPAGTKKPAGSEGITSLQYAIYGFLTWLFAFGQMKLLVSIIPGMIATCWYVLDELFRVTGDGKNPIVNVTGSNSADIALTVFSLKGLIRQSLYFILHLIKHSSTFIGMIMMAMLYAWYSFDPRWISMGRSPNDRFSILEKYFAYFLGFGTPFALLIRYTSFFIGFGSFLTVFPFCIILGSVLDYTAPYREYEVRDPKPVRVFRPAQAWTLLALQMVGNDMKKKLKISSEKDSRTKKTD